MTKKLFYYLSVCLIVMAVCSCSSTRKMGREPIIGGLKGTDYTESLISQSHRWENLTAKASVSLQLGDKGKTKVNATLRIRRGEVIRLSVAPLLGIEVARMDITPENILLIDRLNKRYVRVSFKEISRLANTELNFNILQSLFLNELFLPDKASLSADDAKAFSIRADNGQAVLEARHGKAMSYRFRAAATDGLLEETSIALKDTDYGLTWKYADFGRVDGKTFPQHMHVTAGKGEVQNLSVDMKLSRLSASDGWDAQTELSSKYQEVELTELLQLLLNS